MGSLATKNALVMRIPNKPLKELSPSSASVGDRILLKTISCFCVICCFVLFIFFTPFSVFNFYTPENNRKSINRQMDNWREMGETYLTCKFS